MRQGSLFQTELSLRAGAGALSASKDALFAARAAVEAEEVAQAANSNWNSNLYSPDGCGNEGRKAATEVALTAAMKAYAARAAQQNVLRRLVPSRRSERARHAAAPPTGISRARCRFMRRGPKALKTKRRQRQVQ